MSSYAQAKRFLAVNTPLGPDKLLLFSLTGQEQISRLFSFRLDMLSEDHEINFDDIVGKNVTFSLRLADAAKPVYYNGFVSRFAQLPDMNRFAHYQAEVVPWLWFLTRTKDCRIFQHETVPDIIQEVFSTYGFKDFRNSLEATYREWEYCVQYRETACDFVMRLMEQEGIFFYFEHAAGKHTLVLADSPSAHSPCAPQATVRYVHGQLAGHVRGEDIVDSWQLEHELRPGKYALKEFYFETPNNSLLSNSEGRVNQGDNKKWEVYDYPGEYEVRDDGDSYTKVRMDEEETPHAVVRGRGNCRSFSAGRRFDLADHPRADQNGTYVLTSVEHAADDGSYFQGQDVPAAVYENSFTCIPHSVPFRPARTTPVPHVRGTQTAIVVGPAGEEIYTDKYGRVKVQFHWDRRGQYDENSSCWIRVAQNWAGKKWGAMFLPRIGQEVIVDFLEGDIDRPLVVGRVYNAVQMPPYTLPDEKTKSAVKSYSSKGGAGFNEFRFEDKKGSEQVFMHAEKNMDIRVKNDLLEIVLNNNHQIIEKDQLEHVKGDKHDKVTGDHNEQVDGTVSLKAGVDMQEKVGQKYALDAGMEIHLKAGTNVVIESGTTLTLKVGGNFININSAGIFIKGTMLMLNSGGAAGTGSGSAPDPPTAPQEADTAQPGEKAELPPPPPPPTQSPFTWTATVAPQSATVAGASPAAAVMREAAQSGAPFCDI
jgi:type VI secretion system secreted protein VgrG